MDALLDFLLTVTGLRIVLEALVLVTLTLAGVGIVTMVAGPWSPVERFRAMTGPTWDSSTVSETYNSRTCAPLQPSSHS